MWKSAESVPKAWRSLKRGHFPKLPLSIKIKVKTRIRVEVRIEIRVRIGVVIRIRVSSRNFRVSVVLLNDEGDILVT